MKQQKYYIFLQKQILLMIGLSLLPGLVYVILGWVFGILLPALLWYIFLLAISLYGWSVYKEFSTHRMNDEKLKNWYKKLTWFMYTIFSSWSVIFVMYVGYSEYDLNYIAIFTQVGASVVASALLVSDKKLFVPILLMLMLPLIIYFLFIDAWYGYILSLFSLILLAVLLYAAHNTYILLEKNYYQVQHDVLTGLYNRRYFMEYMESLNEGLEKNNKIAYIFLVDLDYFKTINDSLGHDMGDKLLIEVAKRIEAYTKGTHVAARLGGDEFMIVSRALNKEESVKVSGHLFAEGMLGAIREPYVIDNHHLQISASIGVHKLNSVSSFSADFIREVDIAMYEAKTQGRDGIIVFNKELEGRVDRLLSIEQKLHHAMKENKIKVYYQPQFDKHEKLVGCESLARWSDSELGVLGPQEFIPIAEKTGLILELGSYMLKKVFETLYGWDEKGKKLKSFSVNISMRQLLSDNFINEIDVLMKTYFIEKENHPRIIFEITEHVFAKDIKKVISTMNGLKKLGISFSIDDFGTGYSSLSYLSVLPIDEVKIDKSFIGRLNKSENDKKLVGTIIAIAKNFDLSIVAEGVETLEQLAFLREQGCDVFQGFYFEEALPQSRFEEKYLLI